MADVDILVCTALPTEYKAAMAVGLEGFGRDWTVPEWVEHDVQPYPYVQGTLQVGTQQCTIALARPTRMAGEHRLDGGPTHPAAVPVVRRHVRGLCRPPGGHRAG